MHPEEVRLLVTKYKANRNDDLFKKILDIYKPIIYAISRSYINNTEDRTLITHLASINLFKAICNWNPRKKVQFNTYLFNYFKGLKRQFFKERITSHYEDPDIIYPEQDVIDFNTDLDRILSSEEHLIYNRLVSKRKMRSKLGVRKLRNVIAAYLYDNNPSH